VIFWITAPCNLVLVSSSGMKMKAAGSSETSVPNYETVTLYYQTLITHAVTLHSRIRNFVHTIF
jgi:hypothetical protein